MHDWLVPLAAIIGVVGQWYVSAKTSARRDGERDQQLKSFGYEIRDLKVETRDLQEDASELKGRVSKIEGRLDAPVPHRR